MYYNLTAIILKRQSFKDDDLLITLYSLERGKLALQARSAKKILSKLAGHLEPLTLSNLNVTLGKNIDQLIGASAVNSYYKLKNNIEAIAYANYFIELVDKLTPDNHPDEHVFTLLGKSLDYLESHDHYPIARICFGYKLLHFLGFSSVADPSLTSHHLYDYIITNTVDDISRHGGIRKNLAALNKILDKQLDNYLERQLISKEFLKQVHKVK